MAPAPQSLTAEQRQKLQSTLDDLVEVLPCAYLTVVTPTETLFNGWTGKFDVLDPKSRAVNGDDVVCFYSTTKLITSVAYLTLVDQGVLSLDTKMTDLYPPLKEAAKQILTGFDEQGQPKLVPNDKPITLLQMLNQSSGFGMEFGETVQAWKKVTPKGKGYVNSCKIENLIHTPICYEPGTVYEYGNSAEWLALILPTIVGKETEEYYQEAVLKPLGMNSTTFYPFTEEFKDILMPLRFGRGAEGVEGDYLMFQAGHGKADHEGAKGPLSGIASTAAGEKTDGIVWEVLDGQLDLLKLPRTREEIENPAGGGGIYSKTSDYAAMLQYLLRHYLSLSDSSVPAPSKKILSDRSVESLFKGTLAPSALNGIAQMAKGYYSLPDDHPGFKDGEMDWTTGVALYQPFDGSRREGWGRQTGSVGWGGAAGTEYWMDPKSGIAVVFTTQMLPGRCPPIANAKKAIEKVVYDIIG